MTPRDLPSPGVTVLAPTYRLLPGGKGANQAYACAKLGHPRVKFVGATGDDDFANIVLRNLEAVGVDCGGVAKRADAPTACASVIVDAKGENQICVGSGANATVTASQLDGLITERGRAADADGGTPGHAVTSASPRPRRRARRSSST